MTSPADAKCCCCINLRLGVLVYLGLNILFSAASVVTTSSSSQFGGSSSSNVLGVLVNVAFAALTLFFAAKRMNTGYKVCVYIQMIIFILLLIFVVLFIAGGSVLLASGSAKSSFDDAKVDPSTASSVFTIVSAILGVILAVQAYFLSVLWRYIRVMQDEIAERKHKQVTA
ncbi:hypothetical protein BCR44DRAFT_42819 [Catenaria anguillulae PL171]|uniref:Uncharacterized protein n=1 Tax=Catenaria anguillulae PL171 TaxID=765915 RepID=A0A1Y2H5M3_9FUNG|nr:hypothetical protein BCR44DRAFT_42819 [Catenaria anguillulae PL171]